MRRQWNHDESGWGCRREDLEDLWSGRRMERRGEERAGGSQQNEPATGVRASPLSQLRRHFWEHTKQR